MSEVLKTLAVAAGYGGTVRGPGVSIPAYDTQDWDHDDNRCLDRLAEAVADAAACEIFKDDGGALYFGVRPGLIQGGQGRLHTRRRHGRGIGIQRCAVAQRRQRPLCRGCVQ